MKRALTIIGIIPQYPRHSQQNIYARIKMPPVGVLSVMSQIHHHPRIKEIYAIDENNFNGPQDSNGLPDHSFLQARQPAQIALFYGGMSNSIQRMYALAIVSRWLKIYRENDYNSKLRQLFTGSKPAG